MSRSAARGYLAKAKEFLDEARTAEELGRHDATMLGSLHAGICAVDAVCAAQAGRRSSDPDHNRAADLLVEIGRGRPGFKQKAQQLLGLLAKKNSTEYESRRATHKEAREAILRASRLVEWAEEIVRQANV